jgi:tRNA(Ile)-lysidine synthase
MADQDFAPADTHLIDSLPAATVERFRRRLDQLVPNQRRLAVAVSGGPDSLALLLLAAAARPGEIIAATVDHGLRDGSRAEAEMVAALCQRIGVPHEILTATWKEEPTTAIQERARIMRYRLLAGWAKRHAINVLLSAHHADDQAETFLMRLVRGSGVRGLSAMRPVRRFPGLGIAVVRPLLGWRRSELAEVLAAAGVTAAADPSNDDEQFERVRMRKALGTGDWANPVAIARSAGNLAQADEALRWATTREWKESVKTGPDGIVYTPGQAPTEIRRRIARRAVLTLAAEASGRDLRGPELDRLVVALASGRKATLRGVLCSGGSTWRFSRAPERRG